MALRLKTIEYALDNYTATSSVATAVSRNYAPKTFYIPETGSRRFVSCFAEVYAQDNVTTAAPTTAFEFAANLVGGTPVTGSNASTYTTTGEAGQYVELFDLTRLFINSWGDTNVSQSLNASTKWTGVSTINVSAKIIITYEYDDAVNTRVKTVTLPINSITGSLNAATSIKLDDIPALLTELPEEEKTFRDVFVTFKAGDGRTANNDSNFQHGWTNTSISSSGIVEGALITDRYFQFIVCPVSSSLLAFVSSSQALWARTTNVAAPYPCLGATITATYEYNHSASTRILNSIIVASGNGEGVLPGITDVAAERYTTTFPIQEPAPISSSKSGLEIWYMDSSPVTVAINVTGSTSTTGLSASYEHYVYPSATVEAGSRYINHVFDGGSTTPMQGKGVEWSRGDNAINLNWYRTTGTATPQVTYAGLGTLASSWALINYISEKSSLPGGDANHSHTIKVLTPFSASSVFTASIQESANTFNIHIPESGSGYYMHDVSWFFVPHFVSSTLTTGTVIVSAQPLDGEGTYEKGIGYRDVWSNSFLTDAEFGPYPSVVRLRHMFRQYARDPRAELFEPSGSRKYKLQSQVAFQPNAYMTYTYHTIKFPTNGTVSNYAGDGNNLRVRFYESGSGKFLHETYTTASGVFSASWYDNTKKIFAEVFEDDTHVGRSTYMTASGNP